MEGGANKSRGRRAVGGGKCFEENKQGGRGRLLGTRE